MCFRIKKKKSSSFSQPKLSAMYVAFLFYRNLSWIIKHILFPPLYIHYSLRYCWLAPIFCHMFHRENRTFLSLPLFFFFFVFFLVFSHEKMCSLIVPRWLYVVVVSERDKARSLFFFLFFLFRVPLTHYIWQGKFLTCCCWVPARKRWFFRFDRVVEWGDDESLVPCCILYFGLLLLWRNKTTSNMCDTDERKQDWVQAKSRRSSFWGLTLSSCVA